MGQCYSYRGTLKMWPNLLTLKQWFEEFIMWNMQCDSILSQTKILFNLTYNYSSLSFF